MTLGRGRALPASALLMVATFSWFPAAAGELAAGLQDLLVTAPPDERLPIVVLMDEFPDRGALDAETPGHEP